MFKLYTADKQWESQDYGIRKLIRRGMKVSGWSSSRINLHAWEIDDITIDETAMHHPGNWSVSRDSSTSRYKGNHFR